MNIFSNLKGVTMRPISGFILSSVILLIYGILKFNNADSSVHQIFENLESWIMTLILLLTLICMLTENIEYFNFDKSAIVILILSGILLSSNFFHFVIVVILIILLTRIAIKKWYSINQTNWNWIVLSIVYTSLVLIPTTIISVYIIKDLSIVDHKDIPSMFVAVGIFIVHISSTAVWEEVFFRGLLWGYLKKMGLSIKQVALVQFVIFWLLHYDGQSSNLNFYIALPLEIFVQTLLVYKSKQLTPSIISHALYNTFAPILWRFFV
jgi:membrane protease YdiL (CAAX protease family)